MKSDRRRLSLIGFVVVCSLPAVGLSQNLDISISRIHGDMSRVLLGDGTGIRVGVIDSGVDATHPALAGNVVAMANYVTSEPSNIGDDVYGHGTAVAAIIAGRQSNRLGLAPRASIINARVLDTSNGFSTSDWVVNGTGYAIQNGANVLNLSLAYFNHVQDATSTLSLMCDYISGQLGIPVVAAAGNYGNNSTSGSPNNRPQGPGDAFNVLSVASTHRSSGYNQITSSSSWGGTSDGRSKPDIAAPGDQVVTANDDWETGSLYESWSGTSFATPHVAGLVTQQLTYGRTHGISTDPLVIKATMLNSAEKVARRSNQAWTQKSVSITGGVTTALSPLDDNSGAGQVDGLALYEQYSAGQHAPGSVPNVGWDLRAMTGTSTLIYDLPYVGLETWVTATLTWNREVAWSDRGTIGVIDSADLFSAVGGLDNLNLALYRDGALVAQSISTVDNLEHLYFKITLPGDYDLRVSRLNAFNSGNDATFAMAWHSVPEPGVVMALPLAGLLMLVRRQR